MTHVVDASVVAEVLLATPRGREAATALMGRQLVAPSHLGVEVASVIRGWCLGGHLRVHEAEQALREYARLGVETFDLTDRLGDVIALRHNLSAYDAMYVVLARALACPLVTFDERLLRAAPDQAVLPNQL